MLEKGNYFEYDQISRLERYSNEQFEKQGIPVDFSSEVAFLSPVDLIPEQCAQRVDLRNLDCFTIDCDDTHDMDDAVSLHRHEDGYTLGVHIADVAAYVTPGSTLDAVAAERGTSIYLPHQTIPMLPQVLSNNLCSLNPGEDRNAVSVLIRLDKKGNVRRYKVIKSLIRSRLKGSYSEVNRILDDQYCNEAVTTKYSEVMKTLYVMRDLAETLRTRRKESGANISENVVPKISFENGFIEIRPLKQGSAENIIEEFMVLANQLVAEYLSNEALPVIYRVQKQKQTKARYATTRCRHAELSLEQYVHFTSPIRRLSDLKVHQIISAHIAGMDRQLLNETFDENLNTAADRASRREIRAEQISKSCNRMALSLFFSLRQRETYFGDVVAFNNRHQPVIYMLPLHVNVVAPGQKVYIGEHVAFKINVDEQRGHFTAHDVKPRKTA